MSRTLKVLRLLQLYNEQRPALRAPEVARQLQVSLATAYRCIADLEAVGLVESTGAGEYTLGPAIVELDRQIRIADPLIAAASEVCTGLSERTRGTVLLCRLHGLKVLCVHSVAGAAAPRITGYERGRAMVLYRGATSLAILAHAPEAVLRQLVAEDAAGLQRAGWPSTLPLLQARLRAERARKVLTTAGAVNAQACGWAVPLFAGPLLLGSLSVVRERAGATIEDGARIGDALRRAALRIEARVESHGDALRRASRT
ncbi:MAG: helix-turn-helix domain-containing protein [Bordetella sp.]|nr:helix-turn-helix domain-containing protein [Bordetella sp.]